MVDTRAPAVSIGQVTVNGDSATVAFSSDDASAAIKCKLDGAAFAGCTNPAVFKNLASGAHTVVVQATDASGNVSSATRTFSVAPGAGNPYTPSGGDPADATAPKVRQPDRPGLRGGHRRGPGHVPAGGSAMPGDREAQARRQVDRPQDADRIR